MIKKCLRCNTEFYIRPSTVKIGSGKYCSEKCYHESRIGIKSSKSHRDKISKANSGCKHWRWINGRTKKTDGYILVYAPDHPNSTHNRILEHRFIVEQQIGRYLTPKENVHHINGIRDDNRLENLMAFVRKSAHHRFHKNPDNVKPEEIIFDGRRL